LRRLMGVGRTDREPGTAPRPSSDGRGASFAVTDHGRSQKQGISERR